MTQQGAAHHHCVCVASVALLKFPLHFDLGEGNERRTDYTEKKGPQTLLKFGSMREQTKKGKQDKLFIYTDF